jgi:hypothetical protein
MKKPRTPVPGNVSAEVMFQHDRTCCICCEPGLAVQIHHLDEDPTNHAISNLAVLCLEHHEQTQVRGGFGRKLTASDVVRHRDDWIERVSLRRQKADEFVIQRMSGLAPPKQVSAVDWNPPSEAAITGYIKVLPHIRRGAISAARPLWDSGITSEMRRGSYEAIEILSAAWIRLANFYPPKHFGEKAPDQFFSEFVVQRFAWHRRVSPRAPGSSGTMVAVIAGSAVLEDISSTIAETVEGLVGGYCVKDFDLEKWRGDWDAGPPPSG